MTKPWADLPFPAAPENSLHLNEFCGLYIDWYVFEGSEDIRLRPDVEQWCRETLKGAWTVRYETVDLAAVWFPAGDGMSVMTQRVLIRFDNPADQIAFKLGWL